MTQPDDEEHHDDGEEQPGEAEHPGGDEEQPGDIGDMAQQMGVSRAAVYQAVARGEIAHVRMGRRILIPRSALRKWLEGGTEEPPG